MTDFASEFAAHCKAHGTPERIELLLCDINAILRGKWLPGDQIDKLVNGGVRLPMSTYAPNILGEEVEETGLGIVAGDPDGQIIPVPGTLRPVPWGAGNVAQVLVEMGTPEGKIAPLSSRQILGSVLKKFDQKGWHPVVATELEFYLLTQRAHPHDPPTPPTRSPNTQNYDMEVLDRAEMVMQAILDASKIQELPTDTLIAEYGPGQFEINFHHTDDVLAAADTAVLFRRLVRAIAARHGLEATFMAKPYSEHPGNGLHVHVSVTDEKGQNILSAPQGLSQTLSSAVAGLLHSMRDFQAIFAPHLNSYRRFGPMSFAPSAPNWGHDHRGAAVRIPETQGSAARLEHRISGADANPYLLLAAILGGMLHGLDTGLVPPGPMGGATEDNVQPLEHDWSRAVSRFASSRIAREVLGEEFCRIYATIKQNEIAQLSTQISPTEYKHYLSRL